MVRNIVYLGHVLVILVQLRVINSWSLQLVRVFGHPGQIRRLRRVKTILGLKPLTLQL